MERLMSFFSKKPEGSMDSLVDELSKSTSQGRAYTVIAKDKTPSSKVWIKLGGNKYNLKELVAFCDNKIKSGDLTYTDARKLKNAIRNLSKDLPKHLKDELNDKLMAGIADKVNSMLEDRLLAKDRIGKPIALGEQSDETEKAAAATKIQAAMRGTLTREKVVLPGQIREFLEEHLLAADYIEHQDPKFTSDQIKDISRAVCRQINEMALNPKEYSGKSVIINQSDLTPQHFPVFNEQNVQMAIRTFNLKFDCWIEMSEDGQKIALLIVPPMKEFASGTYKDVFHAHQFEVPLQVQEGERAVEHEPSVYLRPVVENQNGSVQQGMEMQGFLIKHFDKHKETYPDVKIAQLPQSSKPMASAKSAAIAPEFKQAWYNGTLANKTLPKDQKKSEMHEMTRADKANAIRNAAVTLRAMHELGIVHRDVKPPNILVKLEKDRCVGYLSDFDLVTKKAKHSEYPYAYWDPSARNGIATPFTDLHGLTITLAESFLPLGTTLWTVSNQDILKVDRPTQVEFLLANMQKAVIDLLEPKMNIFDFRQVKKEIAQSTTVDDVKKAVKTALENTDEELLERVTEEILLVESVFALLIGVLRAGDEIDKFIKSDPKNLAKLPLDQILPKDQFPILDTFTEDIKRIAGLCCLIND